jgi:hypothetical protein
MITVEIPKHDFHRLVWLSKKLGVEYPPYHSSQTFYSNDNATATTKSIISPDTWLIDILEALTDHVLSGRQKELF